MLETLFKHMHWADAVVWHAIYASSAAMQDARVRELQYHLHMVQHAFLSVWRNKAVNLPKISAFADLKALSGWGQDYHDRAGVFLKKVTHPLLNEPVNVPWSGDFEKALGSPPEAPTLAETMVQVASHSTHHRGQIVARLRELGAEPLLVDFIIWAWLGKPQPDWPQCG